MTNTTSQVFIDLDNPAPLDELEWISKGKVYPILDPPQELVVYRDSHLDIPKIWAHSLLPDDNITVEELLAKSLFKGMHALVFKPPESSYHHLPPNQDVTCLSKRTLLPQSFIDAALVELGQALLDGKKSVEDPRYPGARLLLWVMQFWKESYRILAVQAWWRKGHDWISGNIKGRFNTTGTLATELKSFEQARTHLLSLRWNEETTIPGAASQSTTSDFAGLLASHWITGTHIDMMFQNLSEHTEGDNILDTLVIIENL